MAAGFFSSFWKYLKRSVAEAVSPKNVAFYGTAAIVFSVVAFFLQYQTQVYSSIAAGLIVALLLPASIVLLRGFKFLDLVFISGIVFLIVALLQSDLPVRAVLENVRHFSLILSVALTGLYVVFEALRGARMKMHVVSLKGLSGFFSVVSTTLSSELCSCLHPTLFLETLGIVTFLPNQVRLGFVLMMVTLTSQIRSTYASYKLRTKQTIQKADKSQS